MRKETDFQEKVVVITGAAGGLGEAFCRCFGKLGAKIAAIDIDQNGLKTLQTILSDEGIVCKSYVCNVSNSEECFKTIEQVISELGDIFVLVNNAGVAHRSAFFKTDTSVFRRVIDVSLFGSIYCTRAAIESLMKTGGAVIGVSSIAGFGPLCGRTAYAAAKHGLAGFLNTLRTEMEDTGVSVMIVYATYIKTNIDKNALDADGNLNQNEKIASGQVLMPDEAARQIVDGLLAGERQLMLGENAQLSWDVYHQDPLMFEKVMMENNRYILEQ
ncbi:MAG: SDR family oxidoreductase [Bacillota bacterium]|nr:SDR family oxidoreductase [Bacillota bacterium]